MLSKLQCCTRCDGGEEELKAGGARPGDAVLEVGQDEKVPVMNGRPVPAAAEATKSISYESAESAIARQQPPSFPNQATSLGRS